MSIENRTSNKHMLAYMENLSASRGSTTLVTCRQFAIVANNLSSQGAVFPLQEWFSSFHGVAIGPINCETPGDNSSTSWIKFSTCQLKNYKYFQTLKKMQ